MTADAIDLLSVEGTLSCIYCSDDELAWVSETLSPVSPVNMALNLWKIIRVSWKSFHLLEEGDEIKMDHE